MDIRSLENESLLLLYLAGELPDVDRLELETLLASDGSLRAQLADLRMLEAGVTGLLARLDRADPISPSPVAARNLSRAMTRWNVERLVRPAAVVPSSRRIPVWGWSIGSVAAAILVFCVWWGFKGDSATTTEDSSRWSVETQGNDQTVSPTTNDNGGSGEHFRRMPIATSMDPASESLTMLEGAVRDEVQ